MNVKISILEYQGECRRVTVSDEMFHLSLDVALAAEMNSLSDDEYSGLYIKLQNYYELKARRLFKEPDLVLDGFYLQTQPMKDEMILDYMKFKKWID